MKVLITGSSSGIGRGIAIELSKNGFEIALHYNQNLPGVQETQKMLQDPSSAKIFQCDLSISSRLKEMYAKVIDSFGPLDCLVNNAGLVPKAKILEATLSEFESTQKVNLYPVYELSRLFASETNNESSRSIVNISSIHGQLSCESFSAYASSKAAIDALTKIQALEWAEFGIRVNSIAPGVVEVPRSQASLELNKKIWQQRIPLKRYGIPQDIGKLAAFLCKDDSDWITGQVLTIDGGTLARSNLPDRSAFKL